MGESVEQPKLTLQQQRLAAFLAAVDQRADATLNQILEQVQGSPLAPTPLDQAARELQLILYQICLGNRFMLIEIAALLGMFGQAPQSEERISDVQAAIAALGQKKPGEIK